MRARASCRSGSETVRKSTTTEFQGAGPFCEDARILCVALNRSQLDSLSTANMISRPNSFNAQRKAEERRVESGGCVGYEYDHVGGFPYRLCSSLTVLTIAGAVSTGARVPLNASAWTPVNARVRRCRPGRDVGQPRLQSNLLRRHAGGLGAKRATRVQSGRLPGVGHERGGAHFP